MILDKHIEIAWLRNNKRYYISKGYSFTKMGDVFVVDINDLSCGSNRSVYVKCDICENKRFVGYREYFRNKSHGNQFACSTKCAKIKREKTIVEKYGVVNGFQNEEIKRKSKNTCLIRFGFEYAQQSKEIKNRSKQTNLVRYGFETPAKNKQVIEKGINRMIERYGEIWLKYAPKYNSNSIIYLDMISEKLGIPIQHALNVGEKKFVKYWVDGYIEKYNICIEWDERHHKSKKCHDKDNKKEIFLKEKFGCHIIRIEEQAFLKNIDNRIGVVIGSINDIICDSNHKKQA